MENVKLLYPECRETLGVCGLYLGNKPCEGKSEDLKDPVVCSADFKFPLSHMVNKYMPNRVSICLLFSGGLHNSAIELAASCKWLWILQAF